MSYKYEEVKEAIDGIFTDWGLLPIIGAGSQGANLAMYEIVELVWGLLKEQTQEKTDGGMSLKNVQRKLDKKSKKVVELAREIRELRENLGKMEKELVLKLRDAGFSLRDVGNLFGRSYEWVRLIEKEVGVDG